MSVRKGYAAAEWPTLEHEGWFELCAWLDDPDADPELYVQTPDLGWRRVAFPRLLTVSGGHYALVSAADYERVSGVTWGAWSHRAASKLYIARTVRVTPGRTGKKAKLHLHRVVMGCEPNDGRLVDHINGDPQDNRRENLRVTDARGNATNVTSSKNQKLGGFKGVSWHAKGRKWEAHIGAGDVKPCGRRRRLYLGLFVDPADAARAYDAAALKHFGEFAALNFPASEAS